MRNQAVSAGLRSAARASRRVTGLMAYACTAALLAGCVSGGPRDENAARPFAPGTAGADGATAAVPVSASMSPEVLYKLLVAEIAGRRGRLDLAVSNYLEAARETRDAGVAERAVRIAIFARDKERGLAAAKLWSEVAPDSVGAGQINALLLFRAGELEAAIAKLGELAQSLEADTPGKGFARVGELLAREKDKRSAVIAMKRLVAPHPDNVHVQLALGQLLARAAQFEEAAGIFERAHQLDPGNERIVVFHARTLQRLGDVSGALQRLSDYLESAAQAHTVRTTYARMLVDAKRYEDARKQFERLAGEMPENADVRYALGLLLVQTNRLDAAKEHFRALIALGSRREAANFYLGQVAEAQKNIPEALQAYAQVNRGEHRLNAQIRFAVLTAEAGDVKKARAHLHGLRGNNTQEVIRIYRAEGELLARRGDYAQALAVYTAGLEEFPNNSELLYARAMLAEKMDLLDVLERDLRAVLLREPNNADALNALGYTLADRTQRHDEALEFIKRAYELKPDDHYVVDSMGWIMYRMGRYQEALEHLRRAMALNPDSEIAAHLGEVLWVTGDKQEAQAIWDAALQSTPDDKRILDLKKRFGL